VHIVE